MMLNEVELGRRTARNLCKENSGPRMSRLIEVLARLERARF